MPRQGPARPELRGTQPGQRALREPRGRALRERLRRRGPRESPGRREPPLPQPARPQPDRLRRAPRALPQSGRVPLRPEPPQLRGSAPARAERFPEAEPGSGSAWASVLPHAVLHRPARLRRAPREPPQPGPESLRKSRLRPPQRSAPQRALRVPLREPLQRARRRPAPRRTLPK